MSVPKYRLDAIETIGRKILQEYDPVLLDGPPQAVPIETIIETKFDLTLEYHCLRKNGSILGETIFDEGAAILYDQDEKRYRLIAVKAGTILVEERLCVDRLLGRLRFTCAHELGHWVLHQKLYSGTGDVAAYEGKTSLDESHGLVEWQADALATALLMPLPQIKRSFYRLRAGRSNEQLVAEMAQIFQVSKQAMRIRLETRNLIYQEEKMTFEIKDYFETPIILEPRVELYTVYDFMGKELPGLAIVLDMPIQGADEKEQFAILTKSFGEFIGLKNSAYVDINNCPFAPQLLNRGFAKDTGLYKESGFCSYPLWTFEETVLKETGGEKYERYARAYDEYMESSFIGMMGAEDETGEEICTGMMM